jgi:hypothetical protein
MRGDGKPVDHGTSRGYLTGCHDSSECPGGPSGVSCSEARRLYKLQRARAEGVPERARGVDAYESAQILRTAVAAGVSIRSIARATGIGVETLRSLTANRPEKGERLVLPQTHTRLQSWSSAAGIAVP